MLMLLTVELISMGVDLEQGSLLRVDQFKGQSGILKLVAQAKNTLQTIYTNVVDENNLF